ncbi:MAG TPA: hypothetical protein VHI99_00670 [Vicinamibacterales bacterium]|jgi:hypothetical protein|nr:hypothetical protein [Vicinamibacterales bacterium]
MTKKKVARKTARKATSKKKAAVKKAAATSRPASARARAVTALPLMAPLKGVERREIGHVLLEVGRAGSARVKRMIYPPGFRWSTDMKPVVGTDLCMHAHVGFLAHGEIHIEYADGCVIEHKAPQIVVIEPGHDGWVVGQEPVVLIEFDFEKDTVHRLGMPDMHRHA